MSAEPYVYQGPDAPYTSPAGPALDERIEHISSDEFFEGAIDRAIEKQGGSAEPESAAEPESVEGPTEEQVAEQQAWAAGRRDETLAGREAQRVLGELAENPRIRELAAEEQEEFYDRALDLIYDDDVDVQGRITIAKQVAEHAPDRWDEFVEDWSATDPVGPYLFQQQQVAQQNAQARAVYAQQLQEEQEAAHQETIAALEGALKGLSRELKDPTRLVDHSPDAAQIVSQMLEQSPPQSPEEARQLVQLARKGTAKLGDAREVARTILGPLDEAIHRQDLFNGDGVSYEPQPRSRVVDSSTADLIGRGIDPDRRQQEVDVLERARASHLDSGLDALDERIQRDAERAAEPTPAAVVEWGKRLKAEQDFRRGVR